MKYHYIILRYQNKINQKKRIISLWSGEIIPQLVNVWSRGLSSGTGVHVVKQKGNLSSPLKILFPSPSISHSPTFSVLCEDLYLATCFPTSTNNFRGDSQKEEKLSNLSSHQHVTSRESGTTVRICLINQLLMRKARAPVSNVCSVIYSSLSPHRPALIQLQLMITKSYIASSPCQVSFPSQLLSTSRTETSNDSSFLSLS